MSKIAGIWTGVALSLMLAAPVLAEGETADTVVATVNGTNITLGHMISVRQGLPAQYQGLADDVLFKGILDQLVQQEALTQSVATLSKKDQLNLDNDRRGYISGVAIQKLIAGAVTDEALQAAYDARFKGVEPATEYSAAHILVADEAKALEIKGLLDAGGDFAELAKANSTDTGSGANGGDLGWFGKGMMVKPFEDAVVAAEIGKVTGPVKSDFGYHLIMVKETRPAAQPTLDDLREELAAEIEGKAIEAEVTKLTAAATVTRPGEALDPTLLKDATLLDK
ncbi:MAG: peptidylprolyl isomerase [Pseudomonadota bacterium]